MNNELNIPKKIKVGYQKRTDTYTGSLAYVIYYDNKGVLRKEKSWDGWRDHKIDPQEFDNVPTDGFVLNKGVGGARHSYGWNARNEYIRVYDPRGFEFEISVANLLFILQECSAIKGKGLEGEFLYAWNGTELVLLPVCCQEYQESVNYRTLQAKKITSKEVIPGCSFKTKDKQEVMYLGKFTWSDPQEKDRYLYGSKFVGKKKHVFLILGNIKNNETDWYKPTAIEKQRKKYWLQDGFTKLAECTSDKPIPQFADAFEELSNSVFVSKPVKLETSDASFNLDYLSYCRGLPIFIIMNEEVLIGSVEYVEGSTRRYSYYGSNRNDSKYKVICGHAARIKDNEYVEYKLAKDVVMDNLSEMEVKAMAKNVFVECENGKKYKVEK